jgi:hypothetical protein
VDAPSVSGPATKQPLPVVDGSVFVRREGDIGPDPGQVLVNCILGLKDISGEQSRSWNTYNSEESGQSLLGQGIEDFGAAWTLVTTVSEPHGIAGLLEDRVLEEARLVLGVL